MKKVIFFDGFCPLCNGFVDFALNRDIKHQFYFSSLQSITAKKLLQPQDLSLDSVVYFEDEKVFKKSQAVLRILFYLGPYWSLLSIILSIFPRFISDFIYDIIAKNRYRFFGKYDTCRLPSIEQKNYFLE